MKNKSFSFLCILLMVVFGSFGHSESAKILRRQEFIDSLLNPAPHLRLFDGENQTGQKLTYHGIPWAEAKLGCQKLSLPKKFSVKSVDPLDTCVRLFESDTCSQNSLAVYPGSSHLNEISKHLSGIGSFGPCLKNEFDQAKIISSKGKFFAYKDPAMEMSLNVIPDLFQFDGGPKFDNHQIEEVNLYPESRFYYHGIKDSRLEFIWTRMNNSQDLPDLISKLRKSIDDNTNNLNQQEEDLLRNEFLNKIHQLIELIFREGTADEIDLFINLIYGNNGGNPKALSHSIQASSAEMSTSAVRYGITLINAR